MAPAAACRPRAPRAELRRREIFRISSFCKLENFKKKKRIKCAQIAFNLRRFSEKNDPLELHFHRALTAGVRTPWGVCACTFECMDRRVYFFGREFAQIRTFSKCNCLILSLFTSFISLFLFISIYCHLFPCISIYFPLFPFIFLYFRLFFHFLFSSFASFVRRQKISRHSRHLLNRPANKLKFAFIYNSKILNFIFIQLSINFTFSILQI